MCFPLYLIVRDVSLEELIGLGHDGPKPQVHLIRDLVYIEEGVGCQGISLRRHCLLDHDDPLGLFGLLGSRQLLLEEFGGSKSRLLFPLLPPLLLLFLSKFLPKFSFFPKNKK